MHQFLGVLPRMRARKEPQMNLPSFCFHTMLAARKQSLKGLAGEGSSNLWQFLGMLLHFAKKCCGSSSCLATARLFDILERRPPLLPLPSSSCCAPSAAALEGSWHPAQPSVECGAICIVRACETCLLTLPAELLPSEVRHRPCCTDTARVANQELNSFGLTRAIFAGGHISLCYSSTCLQAVATGSGQILRTPLDGNWVLKQRVGGET